MVGDYWRMSYLDNAKNKKRKDSYVITQPISFTNIIKLIQYVFSENPLITKRSIINLNKYIVMIDENVAYENNYSSMYYFRFLKELCNMIVNKDLKVSLEDINSLFDYIEDNIDEEYIPYNIIDECINTLEIQEEFSDSEVNYFSEWVQDKLTYAVVFSKIPEVEEVLEDAKMDNKKTNKELINKMITVFSGIYRDLNKAQMNSKHSANDFCTFDTGGTLTHAVNNMYNKYTSVTNKLVTGYQRFNEMINGGFEGSRQYIFLGLPKSFKSGTLINMAMTICANNPNYKTRDIRKKPVVVYLTMENDTNETLQRVWYYLTGGADLKDFSKEEVERKLYEFTKKHGIGLRIIFRPHRSVSTDYLYTIVDDMAINGEECICMIQDYTKRIRSTSNLPDIRLELGEVVNEFSVFAKEFDIPLLTVAQLNREAYKTMENMKDNGRKDIAKMLGSSQIGESSLILENTDYGIIINKEDDLESKQSFLSFKLVASRAKDDAEAKYFVQPFENGLKLAEDLNGECLGKDSIGTNFESTESKINRNNNANVLNNRINSMKKVKQPIMESTSSDEEPPLDGI